MAALVVTVAACGGDDGSDEEGGSSDETSETTEAPDTTEAPGADEEAEGSEEISYEDAMAGYSSCLEDHGVDPGEDIPEGTSLGTLESGSPEEQLEMGLEPFVVEAHGDCWTAVEDALAAGATPPEASTPSTTVDADLAQQMTDSVACLNARGWDFLEPGVEAGALEMAPRDAGFDWDDPTFLDDQRECQREAGVMVP